VVQNWLSGPSKTDHELEKRFWAAKASLIAVSAGVLVKLRKHTASEEADCIVNQAEYHKLLATDKYSYTNDVINLDLKSISLHCNCYSADVLHGIYTQLGRTDLVFLKYS